MHTIIVANAPDLDLTPYLDMVRSADYVIGADGGGQTLLHAGVLPQVVIGDLDSLDQASEAELTARKVDLRRYAREKDETDLELALLHAATIGSDQIDVLGALGGRWDHTLANIGLLAHPALAGRRVRLLAPRQMLYLVPPHTRVEFGGAQGDTISLLPLAPAVHNVTTYGMLYPLAQATLYANQARGISNVLIEPPGGVATGEGALIVVQHSDGGAHQWNAQRG